MTTSSGATNLPTDRHWCSVEADILPQVIKAKQEQYWQRLELRGLLAIWRLMDQAYYGSDKTGGWASSAAVQFGGESDELVLPRLNHMRSTTQVIIATATAERPDFQAQSISDETQSLIEAPIATGVIKAWWRQHGLEALRQRAVEAALLYGKGFIHNRWSVHDGDPVMQPAAPPSMTGPPSGPPPKQQQATDQRGVPLYSGDVIPAACSPVSVIHDQDSQGRKLEWAIALHREDAYDLAARYPQFEREIRDAIGRPRWPEGVWSTAVTEVPSPGDTKIDVACVYHKKTSAMPKGRYAIVAADRVLYDGPALMEDEVPVYPIVPMYRQGSGEGHSALWDLLNIVELFDAGASNIATGHDAFGLKIVLAPNGSGFTSEQLSGGMKVEPYEPGSNGEKPEALNIEPVPEGAYAYQDWLEKQEDRISGVNSTARGAPDANIKSGSFAALMDAKTTHFQSNVQRSVVHLDEDVTNGQLKLLKAVGGVSRIAEISGRSGSRLKKVSPQEVETIERVTIEEVNPALSQAGVRWELVQSMLKAGVLTDGQEVLRVFTTGKIEPLFHAPEAQLDLINGENDMLSEGQLPAVCYMQPPPPPAPGMAPDPMAQPTPRTCDETDDHGLHIKEHAALLDLATRRNPAKVKVIKQHIADHTHVALAMDMAVAALTGQSTPVAAPPPPEPGEGAPGDGPPKPGGPPKRGGEKPAERAKPGGGPGSPAQPLMPQNPATGERVPA